MEADPDGATEPLLLVVAGEVAQLLDLQLVALPLVDVGQGRLPDLRRDTRRGVQNILEPGIILW